MGEEYLVKSEIIDYSKDERDGRVLVQIDCPMPDGSSKRAFVDITNWIEAYKNDEVEKAELTGYSRGYEAGRAVDFQEISGLDHSVDYGVMTSWEAIKKFKSLIKDKYLNSNKD